jgi:hypothetical protein
MWDNRILVSKHMAGFHSDNGKRGSQLLKYPSKISPMVMLTSKENENVLSAIGPFEFGITWKNVRGYVSYSTIFIIHLLSQGKLRIRMVKHCLKSRALAKKFYYTHQRAPDREPGNNINFSAEL